MSDLLTDQQLQSRRHAGTVLGYTGASLGLAALGLRGGSGVIRQGAKHGKLIKLVNPEKHAMSLERASNTVGTVAAGVGGTAGLNGARLSQDSSRRAIIKADESWMNISEHNRRAHDHRRSRNQAYGAAGYVAGATSVGSAYKAPQGARQILHIAHAASTQGNLGRQLPKKVRAVSRAIGANPHGALLIGGTALAAGLGAAGLGQSLKAKHHDRAISELRRKRAYAGNVNDRVTMKKSEISKFGPPKVSAHSTMLYNHDNKTGTSTSFSPNAVTAQYRGKSAILRRPKYLAEFNNPEALKSVIALKGKDDARHTVQIGIQHARLSKIDRNNLHQAYSRRKTTFGVKGRQYPLTRVDKSLEPIFKAYDPERSRQKRLDAYQIGVGGGGGALGFGAVQQGRQAKQHFALSNLHVQRGDQIRDKTSAKMNAAKATTGRGSNLKKGPIYRQAANLDAGGHYKIAAAHLTRGYKTAGKAGALGLGAAGALYGAHRIQSYKNGSGRSY